jgi:hypothetical protein
LILTLNGSAADRDGTPTVRWESADSGVNLLSPNSTVTQATFDRPGTWTLNLVADDGSVVISDHCVVQVKNSPTRALRLSLEDSAGSLNEQLLFLRDGKAAGIKQPSGIHWFALNRTQTVTIEFKADIARKVQTK